jgi:hypothetical protein
MTEPSGNLSGSERTFSALIGLSVAVFALRRGSPWVRALSGVTSAALLARAATGHCGVKSALTEAGRQLKMRSESNVSGADDVDAAVNDSFPASDPPASHLPDVPPSNAAAKWAAAQAAKDGDFDIVQT